MEDKFANMGAQMVKEVASKTSDTAGDGTTTATVLAQALYREGSKIVAAGHNPMEVKRGIDKAVEAVVAELKKLAKPTKDRKEIAQVGTISANGDATIGAPMFSNLFSSSISLATVTPSLVIVGEPKLFSMTTLRPFGPSVTFTASASAFTPVRMSLRATSSYAISFAPMVLVSFSVVS
jgi:hypothetical protein